jgi:hypothetical protein
VQPFQVVIQHPTRRAALDATNKIEESPHSPHNRNIEFVSVVRNPPLLNGRSHTDEQNVRTGRIYGSYRSRADCRVLKVAVVCPHNVQSPALRLQCFGRTLGHSRSASQ